jgi:cytochrome b
VISFLTIIKNIYAFAHVTSTWVLTGWVSAVESVFNLVTEYVIDDHQGKSLAKIYLDYLKILINSRIKGMIPTHSTWSANGMKVMDYHILDKDWTLKI